MNIPSTVKVGGKVYTVKCVPHPVVVGGRECYGSIDYNEQIISICTNGNSAQQQFNTFLHELVHAISYERMIDWGDKDEEYTESLAKGLHALIVDNNVTMSGASTP